MNEFSKFQECARDDDAVARVQSWVLGHGDAGARASFEEHLRSCRACRDEADRIAGLIGRLVSPDVPPAENSTSERSVEALWKRLESRLNLTPTGPSEATPSSVQTWRDWPAGPSSGARVVPANDEEFQEIGVPGISVRRLHVSADQREVTMLVRMEGGAAFPPHRHGGLERCLVLSGELHVGDEVARAGDYVGAEAGSLHPVQWTETGCELFITSSTSDELIDS